MFSSFGTSILKKNFRLMSVCIVLLISGYANASTHYVSIGNSFVSPNSITITIGDTVVWSNLSNSIAEFQCGYGYAGTSSPEGVSPIAFNLIPGADEGRKITVSGTYYYKVVMNDFQMYGDVIAVAPLPVELTDFVATTIKNEVILDWSTSGEINNERFEIQRVRVDRKTEGSSSLIFETIGTLQGIGNSSNIHNYTFLDRNLESGIYLYRLKQYDFNGNFVYHSLVDEIEIGVPGKFRVSNNYPNPFNPETSIGLDIPEQGSLNAVIYDVSGKEVSVVFNGQVDAGYRLMRIDGSKLNSGYYFCRFEYNGNSGTEVMTRKIMLLK